MPQYQAAKNLLLGIPGKKHHAVKKGELFNCEKDYFEEHLAPHGHAYDPKEVEAEAAKAKASEKKSSKE